MSRLLILTLLWLALPLPRQAAVADLDTWVQRAMTAFQVPGVSLAVVKDGRVVVAKGYGVRKLGSPDPVDARTLFGIASNTKVFTATALGILVDEGRIRWDAPVIDYLPWFQMSDPYVTREMTVRDLLVHRSGLGLGAGRPALVAGLDLRSEGDRHAAALPAAGQQFPQRLRLRQRIVPRRRGGD
jgi:CubicO group peptidase (beta-lactamase class C family)